VDGIELSDMGQFGTTLNQVALGLGFQAGNPRDRRFHVGIAQLQTGPFHVGLGHSNLGLGELKSRLGVVPLTLTDRVLFIETGNPIPLPFGLIEIGLGRLQLGLGGLQRYFERFRIDPE